MSYINCESSHGRYPGDKLVARQTLNFQVALFRVKKQISAESLEYFRTMNQFILIESNQRVTYWNYIQNSGYAIPMIRLEQNQQLDKNYYALTVRMTYPNQTDSSGEIINSRAVPFAIITARYLPTLVRLINALHGTKFDFRPGTFNIRLLFGPEGDRNTPAFSKFLDIVTEFRGFNRLDWGILLVKETVLDSNLKSEMDQNKLLATGLPYLNWDEIPMEARKTKEIGDELAAAGRYGEARSEYAIAAVMVGIDFWRGGSRDGKDGDLRGPYVVTDEMKTFKLQLYTAAAMVEDKTGCYTSALTFAMWARRGTRWRRNNDLLTPGEEVKLLVLTGSLQTRFKQITEALPNLERALEMSPSEDIREKIKAAKAVRLKKYYAERDELLARWAAEKEHPKDEEGTETQGMAGEKRKSDSIS